MDQLTIWQDNKSQEKKKKIRYYKVLGKNFYNIILQYIIIKFHYIILSNDFINSFLINSMQVTIIASFYNRIYPIQLDIQSCNKRLIIVRVKLSGDTIEFIYLQTNRFFQKSVVQISICSSMQFCWKTATTQRNPNHEWQSHPLSLFCNFEIVNLTVPL